MSAPIISLVNDQPRTLSTDVAAFFGKTHKHILRDIRNIMANCPESFNGSNFGPVEIVDAKGEKRPAYSMTFDAFMLVTMSLTGPKAMQSKLAYMAEFNRMREELATRTRDTFRLTAEDEPRAIDTPTKVKDRKPLNALINTWVSLAPLSYRDAWQQVKTAFGVESADGLTLSQIKPACDWVQSRIDSALSAAPALSAPAANPSAAIIQDILYETKRRALENTKLLNQLSRQITELDTRCFQDYLTLDDCWTAMADMKPFDQIRRAASA